MSRGTAARALALAALASARPVSAQYVPEPGAVSTGAEARYYHFGQDLGVKSLGQVAVPARGRDARSDGSPSMPARGSPRPRSPGSTAIARPSPESPTPRSARAYVLGSDAVVLTAMVNLPTGAENLTAAEYAVLSAASSSFLAFPVNAYGSGASATLGAAGAVRAGEWNLGLAGERTALRGLHALRGRRGRLHLPVGPRGAGAFRCRPAGGERQARARAHPQHLQRRRVRQRRPAPPASIGRAGASSAKRPTPRSSARRP